jgi:hypothetical protein
MAKILIIQGAFGDQYEPAWMRALNHLGHDVSIFNCHDHTSKGLVGRIERRVLIGIGINKIQNDIIRAVIKFSPDIILLYQGHYILKKTIIKLKKYSFIVGYHNDNPFTNKSDSFRYRHLLKALPAYQGFHVYRPSNINDLKNNGVSNVSVLMPAFLPWIDFPRKLSVNEINSLSCDVFYAGHCENDIRVKCFAKLINSGINLRIFGDPISWKRNLPPDLLARVGKISHIIGDDYRKAISAAKICLCFFSKANQDIYTRRVFEITACGGFLLCERTDEMMELFPEGIAADYFSSPEELMAKISFYLKNPELRNKISKTGLEVVNLQGHDIHSRMRSWINEVLSWKANA